MVREYVNLYTFLKEIIARFEVSIFSRGLLLECTHNLTELSKIETDKLMLTDVVFSYLFNAIKYSYDSRRILLGIITEKNKVVISVTDFGVNSSVIRKIDLFNALFKRHERPDVNTYQINDSIEKWPDYEIYVDYDSETYSTCFSVEINKPVFFCCNQLKKISLKSEYKPISNSTIKKNAKILLVDDNELMIQYYLNILSEFYICDFAYDGIYALEKIRLNQYDCIILDIVMPNMNGVEFLYELRQNYSFSHIPIIFVTSNDLKEIREEVFCIGINDFIVKPFIPQEFLSRIANVIHNQNFRKAERGASFEKERPLELGILEKVYEIIIENMVNNDFSVQELASLACYSRRHLGRKVKKLTGMTPRELILEIRLKSAYDILKINKEIRIGEVQQAVGIKNTSYFNRSFKKRFGTSPSNVRDGLV